MFHSWFELFVFSGTPFFNKMRLVAEKFALSIMKDPSSRTQTYVHAHALTIRMSDAKKIHIISSGGHCQELFGVPLHPPEGRARLVAWRSAQQVRGDRRASGTFARTIESLRSGSQPRLQFGRVLGKECALLGFKHRCPVWRILLFYESAAGRYVGQ